MYLVTANGTIGYGAEMYAIGIFDTKEAAEKAKQETLMQIINNYTKNDKIPKWATPEQWCSDKVRIVELEMNTTYPLVYEDERERNLVNEKYVGGYSE